MEYGFSIILFFTVLLILLFSYILLTMDIFYKVVGENPGSFLLYPLRKTKYIILTALYIILLIAIIFSTIFFPLELSKARKHKFLNSSKTKEVEGIITKIDSIHLKNGKKAVAHLNYKIDDKNYEFELNNPNRKFKINQKLKYSLKHHDMFKIIK